MKKRFLPLFLISFVLSIFILSFVFAVEGCCENLKDGRSCRFVDQSECSSNVFSTSCESHTPCILGTCVDTNKGECMPNTPSLVCSEKGGQWDQRSIDEIPSCQLGCCLIGDQAHLATQVECTQTSYSYGVENQWDPSITESSTCSDLSGFYERGACVTKNEYITDCDLSSRIECVQSGGDFYLNTLCSAKGLNTGCAKTENTICKDGKVYFLDSCGNLANIYDANMFTKNSNSWTAIMEDYWTKMQESNCDSIANPASCGNCDYSLGNKCQEYNRFEMEPKYKPIYGKNTCGDIGCEYKGERYEHEESWCAEMPGVAEILGNPTTGLISTQTRNLIANNPGKYNLPGSRYARLLCMNGIVQVEECADYRNQVCIQGTDPDNGLNVAQCFVNEYRTCYDISGKTKCESDENMCQWVPGYRFDSQIVKDSDREEFQGSCVPLFSPGFQFWTNSEETAGTKIQEKEKDWAVYQGEAICGLASVQENVIYETHWTTKRDEFGEAPTIEAAHRCLENCFAIPDYGVELGEKGMAVLWDGKPISGMAARIPEGTTRESIKNTPQKYTSSLTLEEMHVSLRNGHYCERESDPTKKRLFEVPTEDYIKCIARGETEGTTIGEWIENVQKRADPLFWTNQQWEESITRRAKELGDCGYLEGINGKYNDPQSELITVIFQKLKQDTVTPKEDGETGIQIIYEGNSWLLEGYRGNEGDKTFLDEGGESYEGEGSVLPDIG